MKNLFEYTKRLSEQIAYYDAIFRNITDQLGGGHFKHRQHFVCDFFCRGTKGAVDLVGGQSDLSGDTGTGIPPFDGIADVFCPFGDRTDLNLHIFRSCLTDDDAVLAPHIATDGFVKSAAHSDRWLRQKRRWQS